MLQSTLSRKWRGYVLRSGLFPFDPPQVRLSRETSCHVGGSKKKEGRAPHAAFNSPEDNEQFCDYSNIAPSLHA